MCRRRRPLIDRPYHFGSRRACALALELFSVLVKDRCIIHFGARCSLVASSRFSCRAVAVCTRSTLAGCSCVGQARLRGRRYCPQRGCFGRTGTRVHFLRHPQPRGRSRHSPRILRSALPYTTSSPPRSRTDASVDPPSSPRTLPALPKGVQLSHFLWDARFRPAIEPTS